MKKEATKYCEECQNCRIIELKFNHYYIHCKHRDHPFDDEVIYCKYKKLKKENKRNA